MLKLIPGTLVQAYIVEIVSGILITLTVLFITRQIKINKLRSQGLYQPKKKKKKSASVKPQSIRPEENKKQEQQTSSSYVTSEIDPESDRYLMEEISRLSSEDIELIRGIVQSENRTDAMKMLNEMFDFPLIPAKILYENPNRYL